VRDHLREEILANRLAPGTHLQEEEIALRLGISRAPVREALRLLTAEGLVTIAPRRGAVVKAFSREEFLSAYQVREALEVLAVRLAVPRLTEADLRVLRTLHQTMERAAARSDTPAFYEANAAFHVFLVNRSDNPHLIETYRHLKNQLRRYGQWSAALRGSLEEPLAEHAAILEAVERRDADAAAELLRRHLQVPQQMLPEAHADMLAREGR
jgi:DNA-binding GntR family transcriptional regulator